MDANESVSEQIPVRVDALVRSIRADAKITVKVGIAELIDNALDAGARNVKIEFNPVVREIVVEDDGGGCGDMSLLVGIGDSSAQSVSRLGRYGVGGKKCAIALCDVQHAVSIKDGVRREMSVDWGNIMRSGPVKFQVSKAVATRSHSMTAIRLQQIVAVSAFSARRISEAIEYWSRIYCPSLLAGKKISVDGAQLSPYPFPKLADVFRDEGEFEGRRYRVRAGIINEEEQVNWRTGWFVACAGRLMSEKPIQDGLDGFPGAAFWGYVELLEDESSQRWDLDVHKTGFEEQERFFDSLRDKIDALLEKASEQTRDVRVSQLEQSLSDAAMRMFGGMKRIREQRPGEAGTKGTVIAAFTGKQRQRADSTDPAQAGSVVDTGQRRAKGWRFRFVPLGARGEICYAQIAKTSVGVTFNRDNKFIASHMSRGAGDEATLLALASHFVWSAADPKQQNSLWANQYPDSDDFELLGDKGPEFESKWMNALFNAYVEARAEQGANAA